MVSIIIPNFNHSKFLIERIESILAQTYQNFEVIILDDASTDNSLSIIKQFEQHPKISKIIVNECNSGSLFSQWNKGIEHAKGDLIWIAESDDYSSPFFLSELVKKLQDNPNTQLAFCRSIEISDSGKPIRLHSPSHSKQYDWGIDFNASCLSALKLFSQENIIPNASAVVFRKSKYPVDGWCNSKFKMAGDWWTWIHLIEGGGFCYHAQPLNYHRQHSCTVRGRTLRYNIVEHYQNLNEIAKYILDNYYFNTKEIIKQANILYCHRMIKSKMFLQIRPPQASILTLAKTLIQIAVSFIKSKK